MASLSPKKKFPSLPVSEFGHLHERLKASPADFYTRLEQALTEPQLPSTAIMRVELPEGGMLSANREYLRIERERIVFDVCGAPFGTGFFVSVWSGTMTTITKTLLLLIGGILGTAALMFVAYPLLADHVGWAIAFGIVLVVFFGGVFVFRRDIANILTDLDMILVRAPIIGDYYLRYWRRETYYRSDLRAMYKQAVHNAVVEVMNSLAEAQGIDPISELTARPVHPELAQSRRS